MFISCPNKSLFHFAGKMSRLAALPFAPLFFPSLDVLPKFLKLNLFYYSVYGSLVWIHKITRKG